MDKRRLLEQIGSRLEEIRYTLRLSQKEIASSGGYARTTFVKNEKGDTFPGPMMLYTLGNTYGISLDWLICQKGKMLYQEKESAKETLNSPDLPGPLPKDYKELIEDMEKVPLLRHEALAFYYRFKLNNPELFEVSTKKENIDKENKNNDNEIH